MLGIIGGSNMRKTLSLSEFEEVKVTTDYGDVKLVKSDKIIFCQRHGLKPEDFRPPHAVNYQANIQAVASFKPHAIVGFTSVGSLHSELKPGTLMIPDDYFSPFVNKTFFDALNPTAITPGFDAKLREKIMALLDKEGIPHKKTGVYAHMIGPRFETPSEIKFLANYGDIVGMTAAHEATLAKELEMPYAVIAMIDNYANGVVEKPLTFEQFEAGVKESFEVVKRVFNLVTGNLP